ncbi:MAG TPA: SIMPL domain-containing protein [Longimicrobiales bacterium]|jgi:hypothetical protein
MKTRPITSLIAAMALMACSPALGQTRAAEATPRRPASPATTARQAAAAQVQESFIEVTGSAQRDVPADRATILFAVETEATTAGDAVVENATLMDAVIEGLRRVGAPGFSLETSGFDLQPRYGRAEPQNPADRRIIGYRAANNVSVTVDDVDAVGDLIDAAVGAGANRVAGLSFQARDTEGVRLEVLQEAVEAARLQAHAMATALGLPLGAPIEVRGGAQRPGPRPIAFAAMRAESMAAVSTPVEAGDQTVTASVTIKFRLGGGERP